MQREEATELEPYAIALLALLAFAVAAIVFTVAVVVVVDRSVDRERRDAAGPASEGAGREDRNATGAARAGGEG